MPEKYNNDFAYNFSKALLKEEELKKIDEYTNQYVDMPDRYIFQEIMRAKAAVPQNILDQHIKNLEHFSQMEGFVTEPMKQRINQIKKILSSPVGTKNTQSTDVDSQFFFGGSSLLLWFLTLTALWRRRGYGTPYYGYPGIGYPY